MQDHELERAVEQLRAERVEPGPAFDARVMAAIRHSPRWRFRNALGWWLRPRPVPVSPFRALVAAGVAAALAGALLLRPAPSAEAARPVLVRFVLAAPGASRVDLVGDFNRWEAGATPLRPLTGGGVWMVEIPLAAGPHEYAFLVDGREWRLDPSAPRASGDDYGQPNSMITVGGHST